MSELIGCRLHAKHDLRVEALDEPVAGEEDAIIRVERGGICGSDLHYYHAGGFGPVRVREPIILGHEAAGIVETAPEGSGLLVGQVVSLCPSRPCGHCMFCQQGLERHCLEMRFSGSAMRMPHENGFFRTRLAHPARLCLPAGENTTTEQAAAAEPLAVCLHALSFAGDLSGKRVLVTGAGPIGAICVALARRSGAAEIIVTDVQDYTLGVAEQMGAHRVVNVAVQPDGLADYAANKGTIDVVLECSANPHAIAQAVAVTRPLGIFVQIGVSGTTPLPLNLLVGKEIAFHGTHRFDREFSEAVALISSGSIDLSPMVTHVIPAFEAIRAFDLAGDRAQAVKVQLDFAA
ncbi:L-idonate 5-dehydrogenase [Tianweitania sp. BSSL-BM11]|uniref:L-idonate 5-dehydrogenase n=1 Tax=Tianweitania aestuarii TaxID=2814886 RepID=A0ABS5S2D7_9HYPH|nr:L-idonate 5-dehydrogenase [Tianweitania aestuarii]MBS9722082.1 L-idonate 5-dehydrogenase [Tianweitania aestuarii]